MGKRIAANIEDEGSPPDLLRLLPGQGLLSNEVHYFHDHRLLNRYYFLGEGNVLNLGRQTEGLLARYGPAPAGTAGPSSQAILLVRYGAAAEATAALRWLTVSYLLDADDRGTGRTREGTWAAARTAGPLLIAALDAPTREVAEQSVEAVLRLAGNG
jgi:hypothetical protein